jgi:pimeloyl-ACP methyl ester carboxylesterase
MGFDRKHFAVSEEGVRVSTRESGVGENVLMLHCSASSGRQWEALAAQLDQDFHVAAPDMVGYGGSDAWPGRGPLTLKRHARAMFSTLNDSTEGVHVVGHSCGGALAMRAALELGPKLKSLTLVEPSAFHLLRRGDPGEVGFWYEISNVAADVWHGARSGDARGAMARFVDYWSGPGSWGVLGDAMQDRLAAQVNAVAIDFAALFSETTDIADFAAIEAPVLILQGSMSPAPSRRICSMLNAAFSNSKLYAIEGAGHMSPLTHTAQVNGHIRDHLFRNGRAGVRAAA